MDHLSADGRFRGRQYISLLSRNSEDFAQTSARVVTLPVAPAIERATHVPGAQLDEMTEQPDERRDLLFLLLLARAIYVFAQALNPDITVVQIAERRLDASRAPRKNRERTPPAFLKQLYRVTKSLHRDAHVVQRLDVERFE
jgi:hypothetical protein